MGKEKLYFRDLASWDFYEVQTSKLYNKEVLEKRQRGDEANWIKDKSSGEKFKHEKRFKKATDKGSMVRQLEDLHASIKWTMHIMFTQIGKKANEKFKV